MSRMSRLQQEIATICTNGSRIPFEAQRHILYLIHGLLLFAEHKLNQQINFECVKKLLLASHFTTNAFCECLTLVQSVFNVVGNAKDIETKLISHYHVSHQQLESLEDIEDGFGIFYKLVQWYDSHLPAFGQTNVQPGTKKKESRETESKTTKPSLTRKRLFELQQKQKRETQQGETKEHSHIHEGYTNEYSEGGDINMEMHEHSKGGERLDILVFGALIFLGVVQFLMGGHITSATSTSVSLPVVLHPIEPLMRPTTVPIESIDPIPFYTSECTWIKQQKEPTECIHIRNSWESVNVHSLHDPKMKTLPRILWEETNAQLEQQLFSQTEDVYNLQLTQLAMAILPTSYLHCMDVDKWSAALTLNLPVTTRLDFSSQTRMLLQSQEPSFSLSQYYKMSVAQDFLGRMRKYEIEDKVALQNLWIALTKQWFHNHPLFFPELESLLCEVYHQPSLHCNDPTCPLKTNLLPLGPRANIETCPYYPRSATTLYPFPLSTLPDFLQDSVFKALYKNKQMVTQELPQALIEQLAKKISIYISPLKDLTLNQTKFTNQHADVEKSIVFRQLWIKQFPHDDSLFYLLHLGSHIYRTMMSGAESVHISKEHRQIIWITNVVQYFHGHSLSYPPLEPFLCELFQGFNQVCPNGAFCHVQNFFFSPQPLTQMVRMQGEKHVTFIEEQQKKQQEENREQKQLELQRGPISYYQRIGLRFPSLHYILSTTNVPFELPGWDLDDSKYSISKAYQGWELLLPYMSWLAMGGELTGWREVYRDMVDSFSNPIDRLAAAVLVVPPYHFLRVMEKIDERGQLRITTQQGIKAILQNIKEGELGRGKKYFVTPLEDIQDTNPMQYLQFIWRNQNLHANRITELNPIPGRDFTGHEQWYHILFQLNLYHDCYQWGYKYDQILPLWQQASREWLSETRISEPRLIPFLWEMYRGGKQLYDVLKYGFKNGTEITRARHLNQEWKAEYYF